MVGRDEPVSPAPAAAVPAGPSDAEALFGAAWPAMQRYAAWLTGEGILRGLLGPREAPRVWDRHILNCAAVASLIPLADGTRPTVVDIGSGAGLPGLVVAIMRPDLTVTLVDATARRTQFLTDVVSDLELDSRVRVVTGRVEDQRVRADLGRFDVVTSRAVAPLGRLVGWCLPLLGDGGTVLAIKGATAADEVESEAASLRRQRARVVRIATVPYGGQTTSVVELVRIP